MCWLKNAEGEMVGEQKMEWTRGLIVKRLVFLALIQHPALTCYCLAEELRSGL